MAKCRFAAAQAVHVPPGLVAELRIRCVLRVDGHVVHVRLGHVRVVRHEVLEYEHGLVRSHARRRRGAERLRLHR
eukprot:12438984-Prorocentrum_lima.AAC.1